MHTSSDAHALRTVVFLTAVAEADIPLDGVEPACTLQLGCASFAERVMDSCAEAGLRELDLVVSEKPELLRKLLGDGRRWGMRFRWHLVKDGATPYGILRTIGLQDASRVLIGHGHQWVGHAIVRSLMASDRLAMRVDGGLTWTGWTSLNPLFLHAISPHADQASLALVAQGLHGRQCVIVRRREFCQASDAKQLIAAQRVALNNICGRHVPATWIRRSWGAMSPDAIVDPAAQMTGPVLVGPRCMIAAHAQVGPGVVLSKDVLVAGRAIVREALVLDNTYVAGGITLDRAIAGRNLVQDLKWSARLVLAGRDALVAPLTQPRSHGASMIGRATAALSLVALSPLAAALGLGVRIFAPGPAWDLVTCVTGRDPQSHALRTRVLRLPRRDSAMRECLGHYGGLLDVAQGRRCWFGIRPRDVSQWYALGRDYQDLFGQRPLGLLHSPAWGSAGADNESNTAADAFFAVQAGLRERLRILGSVVRAATRAKPRDITASAN